MSISSKLKELYDLKQSIKSALQDLVDRNVKLINYEFVRVFDEGTVVSDDISTYPAIIDKLERRQAELYFRNGMRCDTWSLDAINRLNWISVYSGFLTDSQGIFANSELTDFDGSKWDVTKCTSLAEMFNNCISLSSFTAGDKWDLTKVTTMASMFAGCSALETVNLNIKNTQNVTSYDSLFYGCASLEVLDGVANIKTDNATSLRLMFSDCKTLTSLDLKHFKTDKVTNIDGIFAGCENIESIDVTGWNTEKVAVTSTAHATSWSRFKLGPFGYCYKLKYVKGIEQWSLPHVSVLMNFFFQDSVFLGEDDSGALDLSGWGLSSVTDIKQFCRSCSSLISLNMGTIASPSNIDADSAFADCTKLKTWRGNFSCSSLMAESLFSKCNALEEVDLSDSTLPMITSGRDMFCFCTSLKTVNLSGIEITGNITNMFLGCDSLTTLTMDCDFTKVDYNSIVNALNASNLQVLSGNLRNLGKGESELSIFGKCSKLTYQSLVLLLNALYDRTDTPTDDGKPKININNINRFSDSEKSVIDNILNTKGWRRE